MVLSEYVAETGCSGPGLRVEDAENVLAGHETLLHIADLQVVQGQHVLLLFLLEMEKDQKDGGQVSV